MRAGRPVSAYFVLASSFWGVWQEATAAVNTKGPRVNRIGNSHQMSQSHTTNAGVSFIGGLVPDGGDAPLQQPTIVPCRLFLQDLR